MRGNVLDMAIGVVVGGAFGKIVTSLVNDIIMPVVGVLTGGINFTDYKLVIQKSVTDGAEILKPEVAVTWGSFIQTIIDFLIIAFCIFLAVKAINRFKRKAEEPAPAPAAPAGPTQEELLTQIRDLLKEQSGK